MASTNEEVTALRNDVSNLSSRLLAVTPNQVVPVVVGQFIIFGCKVTEDIDDTDFTVALEGQAAGDSANLNPNITANPSRGFEFPNIASTLGGMLATNDVTADVGAAPSTGTARYDIAYVFAGKEGAGFAIQAGSPSVATKDDFDTYGLDSSPFGQATITDPDIPSGALAVARIYVEDVFTGIQDARIADIRDFTSDLTAGDLLAVNNLSDVDSASTSATNLGLGTGSAVAFASVNLGSGGSYSVDSNNVLSQTALGSTVLSSALTSLGIIASLVATTADINGGSVDGTVIGGSVAAAGSFTTLSLTGALTTTSTIDGRDVAADGSVIDGLGTASTEDTGTGSGDVPLIGTKSATLTLAGLVEQSTSAENTTGTDDTVWPSVAGVKEMIDQFAGGGGNVSTSGTPVVGDFARFTDATTIEGRDTTEVKSDLGLGTAAEQDTGTGSGDVPLIGTKSATLTLAGLVEQSTSAENVTGTDDTVWPSVAGVKEMIDTHAGGGGGSLVFISAASASNDATVEFSLTGSADEYELHILTALPVADNSDPYFRSSTDGGSNFDNGSTDYAWRVSLDGAASSGLASTGDTKMDLAGLQGSGNVANEGFSATITIVQPAVATFTEFRAKGSVTTPTTVMTAVEGVYSRLAAEDVTDVQFTFNGTNVSSGLFALYRVVRA